MSRFAPFTVVLASSVCTCGFSQTPTQTPSQTPTQTPSEAVSAQLARLQDTSSPEPSTYEQKKYRIGIDAGVYLPTQKRLTDIFGSAVYKLGIDLGTRETILNGRFTPSIGLISAHKDGNDFYLGQLMGSYEVRLGKPTNISGGLFIEPYAEAGLGLAYADYSITDGSGAHFGAKRILPTGQLQAGLLIGHRLRVSLAYDFFESADSFNFNGFAITAAYTIARF